MPTYTRDPSLAEGCTRWYDGDDLVATFYADCAAVEPTSRDRRWEAETLWLLHLEGQDLSESEPILIVDPESGIEYPIPLRNYLARQPEDMGTPAWRDGLIRLASAVLDLALCAAEEPSATPSVPSAATATALLDQDSILAELGATLSRMGFQGMEESIQEWMITLPNVRLGDLLEDLRKDVWYGWRHVGEPRDKQAYLDAEQAIVAARGKLST